MDRIQQEVDYKLLECLWAWRDCYRYHQFYCPSEPIRSRWVLSTITEAMKAADPTLNPYSHLILELGVDRALLLLEPALEGHTTTSSMPQLPATLSTTETTPHHLSPALLYCGYPTILKTLIDISLYYHRRKKKIKVRVGKAWAEERWRVRMLEGIAALWWSRWVGTDYYIIAPDYQLLELPEPALKAATLIDNLATEAVIWVYKIEEKLGWWRRRAVGDQLFPSWVFRYRGTLVEVVDETVVRKKLREGVVFRPKEAVGMVKWLEQVIRFLQFLASLSREEMLRVLQRREEQVQRWRKAPERIAKRKFG